MKKKIIALFLCVLMLVSIATPTASAASLISRIRSAVSSAVTTAAGTEAPADTEVPTDTEAPTDTEVPIDTEAPTDTEAPIDTEAPTDTETPTDSAAVTVPEAGDGRIVLAQNGETEYKLVISANAPEVEKNAAGILSEYLEKISSASFEIIDDSTPATEKEIVIGVTNRDSEIEIDRAVLRDDGVRILTVGVNTARLKGDDVAVLNTTTAVDALQGKVPGVEIAEKAGKPGSKSEILVR